MLLKKSTVIESQLHIDHTPKAFQERMEYQSRRGHLRDLVYGALDGAVTTIAVISGVAGAKLSSGLVIILGLANLAADGISMAISSFMGARSEEQVREKIRRMEEIHIEKIPQEEKEEVRAIFSAKGFNGNDLEKIVDVVTANPKIWVDTMIQEEWGLSLESYSPVKSGLSTFAAFVFAGFLPLIPYLLQWVMPSLLYDAFSVSVAMTVVTFILIGILKGRFVAQPWYWSGFETLLGGSFAAFLAYWIGSFLRGIVPNIS